MFSKNKTIASKTLKQQLNTVKQPEKLYNISETYTASSC